MTRSRITTTGSPTVAFLFAISLTVSCIRAFAQDQPIPSVETQKAWTLAFVRHDNIWIASGDGAAQKLLIANGTSPTWSPDRRQIAFSRDCNLWVAESDGTKQHPLTTKWKPGDPDMCLRGISWNPKHPYVTFSHRERYAVYPDGPTKGSPHRSGATEMTGTSMFDVGTNAEKKPVARFSLEGGTSFVFADHSSPAWSHSGQTLAFARNGDIWVAQIEDESGSNWTATRLAAVASYDEPTMRGSRANHGVTRLSWSPDDKYLAYGKERLQGSGFAELHVLDTSNGNDHTLTDDGLDPCFSPDGQSIVYWSNVHSVECDGGNSVCVWAISLDGRSKRVLVTDATEPVW
jgi:Tol biopolymer transport system component